MEFDGEIVRLLAEVGLMASGYGWNDEAFKIINAVKSMRQNMPELFVCEAILYLNAGKPDDAVKLLKENALTEYPNHDMVKAFLGLALNQAGKVDECKAIAEELIKNGKDEKAIAVAKGLLDELGT